jgi:hypothetical protein
MNADDDRELSEADRLLRRADALLQRHRALEEDDDLPLVTDVVDDPPPALPATPPVVPPAAAAHPVQSTHADEIERTERLVDIDTAVQRTVEAWVAAELPAIIERELAQAADRLHEETVAHLRATLLPRLSERIAERLSAADPLKRR